MKTTDLILLSAAFAISAFTSPTEGEDTTLQGQTYVLVHGAWQAPYVWDEVRSQLTRAGNEVIVVELPGHGNDKTPPHQLSLDTYRDKVINALSEVKGKVILVGHSMGGMVVTLVAEKVPSKILTLVYIGAFLPTTGQALIDLSNADPDSKLGPLLIPSADQLTLDVKQENLTDLFIKDGTQAIKNKVITNYRAEPAIPFINKAILTAEGFGAVEKVYIKTLQDMVISPGLQNRMIAAAGIKTVYEVNTSHSPFLAQPRAVSDLLIQIGQ
ncbi:Pyrethroid hydrolase [Dyadobacter sp. CECT 9275]|uniref:Pyrethroid hydrolase n=1 Tax=Dyadobacter helix TaxID=2822344 RepID=A0A916JAF4_9BACT|nr:alpha/beta fold hydrolase [Dyadobacter sp. CECT 9275]CAG4992562.1 Pyrethroid hydrolase [Dyadobacter sp. CECT 9275]